MVEDDFPRVPTTSPGAVIGTGTQAVLVVAMGGQQQVTGGVEGKAAMVLLVGWWKPGW